MAGTLQVENLIGPTTGANTNTVLVPSGQTLHAPGHTIQTVSGTYSTAGSTVSTTAVQAWTGVSITPKFSTSLIKVECNWFCMHRDYYDGYAHIYRNGTNITGQRKVIRNAAHTGAAFTGGEARSIWYCPAWLWSFTEAAGGTSQITYSIYCWTQDASQTTWWNQASSNTNEDPVSTMILTEIAQ